MRQAMLRQQTKEKAVRSIPILAVAALTMLGACQDTGERSVGVMRTGGSFAIMQIDDRLVPAGLTMAVSDRGRVNGVGPCSHYTAQLTQWGGAMTLSGLVVAPRSCQRQTDAPLDARFNAALATVVSARAGADRADVALLDAEGRTRLQMQRMNEN